MYKFKYKFWADLRKSENQFAKGSFATCCKDDFLAKNPEGGRCIFVCASGAPTVTSSGLFGDIDH